MCRLPEGGAGGCRHNSAVRRVRGACTFIQAVMWHDEITPPLTFN